MGFFLTPFDKSIDAGKRKWVLKNRFFRFLTCSFFVYEIGLTLEAEGLYIVCPRCADLLS